METKTNIVFKYKHIWVDLLSELTASKEDILELFKEITGANFVKMSSLLKNIMRENKVVKEDIIKSYAPHTHTFNKYFELPKDKEILSSVYDNIPEGYGVLDITDKNGYTIEDINTYNGVVKLTFYNECYVNVVGIYNDDTLTYDFNRAGIITDFVNENDRYRMSR